MLELRESLNRLMQSGMLSIQLVHAKLSGARFVATIATFACFGSEMAKT